MDSNIKQEIIEPLELLRGREIISLSSSGSGENSSVSRGFYDSDGGESDFDRIPNKKQRIEAVLPVGFLDPLRPEERLALARRIDTPPSTNGNGVVTASNCVVKVDNADGKEVSGQKIVGVGAVSMITQSCKQFWKAGDYHTSSNATSVSQTVGMDHVRVHPKFLHSNATSHKWALGAFAELLDNALDEVCNGATYVHVDVLENKKDNNKMLLVEDDGGGMTPDKMRSCMSLGYSEKSKMANTIGQYGNGFKTSTMRLGADVIVFSRFKGKDGQRTTQSIGMLSYTFLRSTGKEDIVVPMIHYEKTGENWNNLMDISSDIWQRNLATIVNWSPYESEDDLLRQFDFMEEQGTRIIIYNLWEDEHSVLELDFRTDQHDIQIRGANRDEKKIQMAKLYQSSKHFLTYRHSLRSYASILYRRIPLGFRIILRGKEVDHHDIIDDMIYQKKNTYKPAFCAEMADQNNMTAEVTIGFVKDASHHIDVQGFNVYHKNRLIKPFWRVWNAAGSDGRGVIGVLEANFVEPAHDKQGFERTIVLARLEARLVAFQKTFWCENCHLIGYAPRRHSKKSISPEKQVSPSPNNTPNKASTLNSTRTTFNRPTAGTCAVPGKTQEFGGQARNYSNPSIPCQNPHPGKVHVKTEEMNGVGDGSRTPVTYMIIKLKEENQDLKNSLNNIKHDLQYEKDKNKSLENQVAKMTQKMVQMDQEQELFVASFSEERRRRDSEEEKMRKRLKEASETIHGLLEKVRILESRGGFN